MSKTHPRFTHIAYIMFATMALLIPSGRANAQNDAARILAERVLDAAARRDGGVYRDRDGGIYRNDGIYRRDDRRDDDRRWENERWERERRELERKCRQTNRNSRHCRDLQRESYGRGSSWCWDRDQNGRCDARQNRSVIYRNDRGRGTGRR